MKRQFSAEDSFGYEGSIMRGWQSTEDEQRSGRPSDVCAEKC